MVQDIYRPSDWKDEDLIKKFRLQRDDALDYFKSYIRPQLDRAYKLYIAYNGDRAKEIKKWQANVFVPYPQAVVETLMPRILDARPEFTAQGRTEADQPKAIKIQQLSDYCWEISKADDTSELVVRSSLVYGTGYLQVSWKTDKRTHDFLQTKDLSSKKYKWKEKEQTFYDAPYVEWVDNYSLMYDWHNIPRQSKQFWFKRLVLTGAEIKRRYPNYDKKRLDLALNSYSGDLTDYGSIRTEVKRTHDKIIKGADYNSSGYMSSQLYQSNLDPDLRMHEVFEWWRPFDDAYAVMVNDVPILPHGYMPNPYDFKEAPFIEIPYLKLPNEFEGIGLPLILENPTIMLNMIKNQRLDAATLSIHKMWIVNPLANVETRDLVTRPFGIIYSSDPSGVKPVEFSDIKASSYREEELLKSDMRYASGVDDFSMGVGGGASSATEVRHLRESTLERVRLFINHLGSAYSDVMRYWISMYRQFYTGPMIIRVTGDDGITTYPLVEKDDLMGHFDFKAAVNPSIAGKNDIDKKQSMDLFQLLVNMPFIDLRKLTSKVLHSWNWSLDSVAKAEEQGPALPPGMEGAVGPDGAPMPPPGPENQIVEPDSGTLPISSSGEIPPDVAKAAMALLASGRPAEPGASPFGEASAPINIAANPGAMPPVAPGLPMPTSNPRGMNRKVGGKINTQIAQKAPNGPEAQLMNRVNDINK